MNNFKNFRFLSFRLAQIFQNYYLNTNKNTKNLTYYPLTVPRTYSTTQQLSQKKVINFQNNKKIKDKEPKIVSLYVLRHGQTYHNVNNVWAGIFESMLTTSGISQALRAGEIFEENNIDIDIMVTSNLQRTIETGTLAQSKMSNKCETTIKDYRINEQDVGLLTNTPKTAENKAFLKNNFQKPDGGQGESRDEVITRARSFFKSIKAELINDKKILIVSHSNFLKALIIDLSQSNTVESIPNAEPFKINFKVKGNDLEFLGIESITKQQQQTRINIENFLEDDEIKKSITPTGSSELVLSNNKTKSLPTLYRP